MIIQENTIIHGDSLTVLRQMEPESVDAIITDPPYGINYVSQTGASIKFLTLVAEGTVSIGTETEDPASAAAGGFKVKSNSRLFTREKMRGM